MTTDLITALQTHGEVHKGTDLGGVLQWAILHIQSQAEAIEELRADFEEEHDERLRFEKSAHYAKAAIDAALDQINETMVPAAAQVRKVMLAINEEQLKKAKSHNAYIVGVIADKIEDGTLFDSGIYRRREIAEIVRNLLSTVTEFQVAAREPFGHFKAEPFGWRDCAETDEGAIALYEAPQPQADARGAEPMWLQVDAEVRELSFDQDSRATTGS